MKYKAMIFDLFGTLVYPVSQQKNMRILTEMASALSIDSEIFRRLWAENADARMRGIFKNYQDEIKSICRQIGTTVDEKKISRANKIRFNMVREETVPRADAISVLSKIKLEGYKIGLISNCSHVAVKVWDKIPFSTLFDATIFSCLVGITKPDLRIYHLALQKLDVAAGNCLYIGDGGDQELTGASQAGIQAILLQIPGENKADMYRINSEKWHGTTITSLNEVLELVK